MQAEKRIAPPIRWTEQASQIAWFIAPFLVLLLVWRIAVTTSGVPERIFPSIGAVWNVALQLAADGTLWTHISASLQRVLIGTVIAIFTAIPFGILMGIDRHVSNFF
ncbi:MAG TPA: hypothetical protein VFF68_00900, partial [Anaerolineaceae bacterium]|nr:hypothetical protein [Anaerolineaceae bacterium]